MEINIFLIIVFLCIDYESEICSWRNCIRNQIIYDFVPVVGERKAVRANSLKKNRPKNVKINRIVARKYCKISYIFFPVAFLTLWLELPLKLS